MVIKKFIGKTEEEATAAAKKELGESLVIMNVRQVNPKGIFSFLKEKQVEVTVALEEEREKTRLERGDAERKAVQQVAKVVEQKGLLLNAQNNASSIEQKLDSLQTLLEKQLKKNEAEEQEKQDRQPGKVAVEEKKDDPAGQTAEPAVEDPKAEEERRKSREQEKFIRLLYNTMIENEVDEKYANQILEEVDKSRKPNTPFDYILANIYQKIVLNFGKSEGITPAQSGPKFSVAWALPSTAILPRAAMLPARTPQRSPQPMPPPKPLTSFISSVPIPSPYSSLMASKAVSAQLWSSTMKYL